MKAKCDSSSIDDNKQKLKLGQLITSPAWHQFDHIMPGVSIRDSHFSWWIFLLSKVKKMMRGARLLPTRSNTFSWISRGTHA